MGRAGVWYAGACALVLLCPLALSRHDDDFGFDEIGQEEFSKQSRENLKSDYSNHPLKRLWGVPDTSAYTGRLFRMEIPKEAFSKDVYRYKVRPENGARTPDWLAVDTKHGLISGLPGTRDIGVHRFEVIAQDRDGESATDTFTIEVKSVNEKPQSKHGACLKHESQVLMMILVDSPYGELSPRQKMRALMEMSLFMAIPPDEFWMEPYKSGSGYRSVMTSGPGSSTRQNEHITAIMFNVGCKGKIRPRMQVIVSGVREQAKDGTLEHALRLPVLGWRLAVDPPPRDRAPRFKRQSALDEGSGDAEDYAYGDDDDLDDVDDYSGFGEDEEGLGIVDKEQQQKVEPAPSLPPVPLTTTPSPHPHRHHHGEPTDLHPPGYSAPHTTTDVFQTEEQTTTLTILTTTSTPPPTTSSTLPPLTSTSPTEPPPLSPLPATSPSSPVTEEPTTAKETSPAFDSTNTITTEPSRVVITPYQSLSPSNETPRRAEHSPVVIVPEEPTTTSQTEAQTVIIRESNELPVMTSPSSPEPSTTLSPATSPSEETVAVEPMTSPEPSLSMATPTPTTVPTMTSLMPSSPTTASPTPSTTQLPSTLLTTPVSETTIEEVTEQDYPTSTDRTSTIIGRTTETVPFIPMPTNQPPTLKHHMKKLAITAGKAFRYIIPADLFTDPEENTNLTFTMYEADNTKLCRDSWIQFLPDEREVYGLPLEKHVSRWNFIVEARDSEGLSARGPLDITVQQHKGARTINHKFILEFKLNRPYTNAIDWQIRALEGIVNLFRDTDMEQLTVLDAAQKGDVYEFVWTNDTLPKDSVCPMDDIMRLMRIMADESGSATSNLIRAMRPELVVWGVKWAGAGACAAGGGTPPSAAPAPPDAFPPVPRNQVDLLTATAGHLLVHRVPEDTFFDPEDGGTRNLQLSLRYSDRSELPPGHWLQFDANNQEFYGLPGPGDIGSVNYQLIAEDSNKKSAYDSLLVEVVKAPPIKPTAEFRMTLDYPFPDLAYNAKNKRRVVEKLAALFGQSDTSNIRIASITDSPTTVIWYNTSLPMDRCPKEEIQDLRDIISGDETGGKETALKDVVDQVFDKDLKVMSITIIPLGLCVDEGSQVDDVIPPVNSDISGGHIQESPDPAIWHRNTVKDNASNKDHMITFVLPAVVMLTLIVLGVLIAGILYKRRNQRKMNVGDSEEREAFRPKGIPVIFQDELDERGDAEPAHKSPVIMREEKPPLLPPAPDYHPDDPPYRPPPPFAASRTPPRPKATPTYRKPPPYVPP